jgi:hypothetical protein
MTELASPPFPLQFDVSLQVKVSAPVVVPLHFAADVHASAHASLPQLVTQSEPATHEQLVSAHVHPVPVHVGTPEDLLPPHAAARNATHRMRALMLRSY